MPTTKRSKTETINPLPGSCQHACNAWSIPIAKADGFTLVELLVVLMIVGIIAVYAAPRFTSKIFDARAAAGELREAIRYTQAMSMAHSGASPYQIEMTANGYHVTQGGVDIPDPITNTTPYLGNWSNISLNQTGIILFNSRGAPTCTPSLPACSNPGDSNLDILVSAGSDSITLSLVRLTGYVHVR